MENSTLFQFNFDSEEKDFSEQRINEYFERNNLNCILHFFVLFSLRNLNVVFNLFNSV